MYRPLREGHFRAGGIRNDPSPEDDGSVVRVHCPYRGKPEQSACSDQPNCGRVISPDAARRAPPPSRHIEPAINAASATNHIVALTRPSICLGTRVCGIAEPVMIANGAARVRRRLAVRSADSQESRVAERGQPVTSSKHEQPPICGYHARPLRAPRGRSCGDYCGARRSCRAFRFGSCGMGSLRLRSALARRRAPSFDAKADVSDRMIGRFRGTLFSLPWLYRHQTQRFLMGDLSVRRFVGEPS